MPERGEVLWGVSWEPRCQNEAGHTRMFSRRSKPTSAFACHGGAREEERRSSALTLVTRWSCWIIVGGVEYVSKR